MIDDPGGGVESGQRGWSGSSAPASTTRKGVGPPIAGFARRRSRWLVYLSIFGPGLVAANAGNDAGGIATYSSMGSQFGYQMLWVMVVLTLGMGIVQEMCARMGAVTGKGLSDLIRENFDLRPGAFRQDLKLHRPIYQKTAAYGHFGRIDDHDFTWERTDRASQPREAAGLGAAVKA